jgi:hypothetical protein
MVIPVLLVAALVWGVWTASRRLGEPARVRTRLAVVTAVAAAIWMVLTWMLAQTGVFRRWDATPPPFALLVVGIVR